MYDENLKKAFHVLSKEAEELYLSTRVAELDECISPLEFYRRYISKNIPVVIRNGVKHWSAIKKWSPSYFKKKIGDKLINVAVTPNGYADAVSKFEDTEYFTLPEERYMPMSEFLEKLENPGDDGVYYVQKQNSNFEEFHELWKDIDSDVSWASEAFGTKPDAVNFWMGDSRAVTSMHKDPYENIYCVVSGEKEFTLHPPTDQPWIPYENYPTAVYKEIEKGKWITEPLNEEKDLSENKESTDNTKNNRYLISWIAIDPHNPDYKKYPNYKNAKKISVKVNKGDILYLPSLWYHHVKQSHACIAINYWYDMEYDIKYAYYKFVESLCK